MLQRTFLLLFSATIIFCIGCSSDPQVEITYKQHNVDLLKLTELGEKQTDTGTFVLGGPALFEHFFKGWSRPLRDGDFIHIAAVESTTKLRFYVANKSPRSFDFSFLLNGVYGDLNSQEIEIQLNGNVISHLAIDQANDSYTVNLPIDFQKLDENVISLEFASHSEKEAYIQSRLVGRRGHYEKVYGYLANASIKTNSQPIETKQFQWVANNKFLLQPASSVISLAAKSGASSSLMLKGQIKTSGTANLLIQARTDNQPIWQDLANITDQAFDQAIPINFSNDEIFQLRAAFISEAPIEDELIWEKLELSSKVASISKAETIEQANEPNKKNVIVILLDAARADYFGLYGDKNGVTPNIDQFSKTATVFDNGVAQAPYTTTSIASLMTGLLPEHHGVRNKTSLDPATPTMAEMLTENGYYTYSLNGNWLNTSKYGTMKGFAEDLKVRSTPDQKRMEVDLDKIKRGISAASAQDKPLFLYIHLLPPHWPYYPPAPFSQMFTENTEALQQNAFNRVRLRYKRKFMAENDPLLSGFANLYRNTLAYGDSLTGEILAHIKSLELYDDSLIMILGDHGEAFGEHNSVVHPGELYDELVRVPFIVKLPGQQSAQKITIAVGLLDVFPTIFDFIGSNSQRPYTDGASFLSSLKGHEQEDRWIYSRGEGKFEHVSLRNSQYKFYRNIKSTFLYDIANDPEERSNIIEHKPALAAWLSQMARSNYQKTSESLNEAEFSAEEIQQLKDLGYVQ